MTTPAGPADDQRVEPFWRELGLPGLVDVHVHGMPQRLLDAVWAFFDEVGPRTGRSWPITYRWPEPERVAHLRALGVRAFPSLFYAHKPGMARSLNDWAGEYVRQERAAGHRDLVHSATVFPEPDAGSYLASALEEGARIVKVHVQVGGFDPRDPLLDEAWGLLSDTGTPVVVHTGNGPHRGAFTGPEIFAEVLARHPRLTAVIAHLGMPEYDEFLTLARRFERVHLDTTMVFVDFFGGEESQTALASRLAPQLKDLQDRIVLGTDYPNIPYPYVHQLDALTRTGLDDDWLRSVCWHNGARLLGLGSASGG